MYALAMSIDKTMLTKDERSIVRSMWMIGLLWMILSGFIWLGWIAHAVGDVNEDERFLPAELIGMFFVLLVFSLAAFRLMWPTRGWSWPVYVVAGFQLLAIPIGTLIGYYVLSRYGRYVAIVRAQRPGAVGDAASASALSNADGGER
jgi:hypothetical protein